MKLDIKMEKIISKFGDTEIENKNFINIKDLFQLKIYILIK